ncbi:MAG: hypothetical protein FWC97_08365 [Treponema sp.]|nr:hypothetical protein [Treponema sp.]
MKIIQTTIPFSLCLRVIIITTALFISCQSVPRASDVLDEIQVLPLADGASLYIFANVQEARAIIDLLPIEELGGNQTRQMLDNTTFAVAALFPPESGQRFQIVIWGNYPNFRAETGLRFSRSWRRHRSVTGQPYWFSSESGVSIAIGSRQAFVSASANDQPSDPLAGGTEIPEGFIDFSRGAPLSSWLVNPGDMLSRSLNEMGVPIRFPVRHLFFNVFPLEEDQYEAVIRFELENVSHARGMAAILNIAGGFVSDDPGTVIAALLFANSPVQNENNVDIRTAPMSGYEIMRLFGMFF